MNCSQARHVNRSLVCWAHSLCKNIELHLDEVGRPFIRDPRGSRQNNGDWTWRRTGFFLRWRKPCFGTLQDSNATLIVFSPSADFRAHMEELATRPDWRQGVMDPFCLLVIFAETIFLETTLTINKVLRVLSFTEQVCS